MILSYLSPWQINIIFFVLVITWTAFWFTLFRYGIPIWKFYKNAKNEADFESLSKSIEKVLKKKKHPAIFLADKRDDVNDLKRYKELNSMFGLDREKVLEVSIDDKDPLIHKLEGYKIVVFKVCESDLTPIPGKTDEPLYRQVAQCCIKNEINCILYSDRPGKDLNLKDLNNFYVTTVNFYSKLRETLYILTHFTPVDGVSKQNN
ncbi:MAG: hypothetical protein LBV08_05685 [Clostridiales bacterium]|jgi:hypothetical protein|nr:hypothetical protein [Clostridiales bacterium]